MHTSIDLSSLKNIRIADVDTKDYPDFVDAYLESAEYADGTLLTEEEINFINEDHADWVQEQALMSFY